MRRAIMAALNGAPELAQRIAADNGFGLQQGQWTPAQNPCAGEEADDAAELGRS
jgi:hypothetical protein